MAYQNLWGNVSCHSSSNNAKYLKIYGQKVESTRNSNFGDYPGDTLIWRPGDTVQNLESRGLQTMTFWTLWNEHLLPKRSAKMIDRTEKPKIPSKFAKRDTNILPVILYEAMSWLLTQTGNLLSQPMFLVSSRFRSCAKLKKFCLSGEIMPVTRPFWKLAV